MPEGLDRDETICRIAAEHGYDMGGKAIPMTEELLNSAVLIIVMTKRHSAEVSKLIKSDHCDRIVLFNDYCFGDSSDLSNPHYQTDYVYRNCFDTIDKDAGKSLKS